MKTKTKTKTTKLPTKYVITMNNVIEHPPLTELKPCPRCESKHGRIDPKKFRHPMEFFNAEGKVVQRASHWVLCPKTKEPIILFDRYSCTVTKATFGLKKAFLLKSDEAKNAKPPESQNIDVQSESKTWSYAYDRKSKAKKQKAEKKP